MMAKPELMFDGVPTGDVLRSYCALQLGSRRVVAHNAEQAYKWSCSVLGQRLTHAMLRHTLFAHFVAGEGEASLLAQCSRLLRHRVRLMLCPPMEDIVGDRISNVGAMAKSNTAKYIDFWKVSRMVHDAQKAQGQRCVVQFKPTAVFPAQLMEKISSENEGKVPLKDTAQRYAELMLTSKSTDTDTLSVCLQYYKQVLDAAVALNQPVLIDGELRSTIYMLHALALAAGVHYNHRDGPYALVYDTYQCSLKDTPKFVDEARAAAQQLGIRHAGKCVRGAYVELERQLARRQGRPDPTHPSHAATSEHYDMVVAELIDDVASDPKGTAVFVATNNRASAEKAVQRMEKHAIAADSENVNFGQVYGFCDQLSFALGECGYNVYKSTAWGGTLADWVPYLSRRAAENYSAILTARTDLPQYRAEIKKRLFRIK